MKIGVTDTMFAGVDMFEFVERAVKESQEKITLVRYTVPGMKDLPVSSKKLLEEFDCDIVLALAMVGAEPVDKTCAHEASLCLLQAQLMTNKHVLGVFVHYDEGKNDDELFEIAKDRAYKHTKNAIALVNGKTELTPFAGSGKRQGHQDRGPIQVNK